jgi:hypothetical protein
MRLSSLRGLGVATLAGTLLVIIPIGISSCSSDDGTPAGPGADSGPDTFRPDTGPFNPLDPDGNPPPLTRSQCIATCRTQHGAGFDKDKAIDKCWETFCVPACADPPPGADAGTDASLADASDDAGDDAGDAAAPDAGAPACKNDVVTGAADCDLCTKQSCCAAWDGCFDDPDCVALNDCIQKCDSL